MIDRRRAALAALTLACILALALPGSAAAQAPQPGRGPAQVTPVRLPTVRARPPASRRPTAARPAARPAANGNGVRLAAAPTPMPVSTTPLAPNGEAWAQISPEVVNGGTQVYPVGRGHLGPSVLRVQVLLDRALFSPGMLDGRWGRNTQNAVYWLQAREGLQATGVVDSATYVRLQQLAGQPSELVRRHTLTAEDVRGPFRAIPANIYDHAQLSCSCYESLGEKLTESFHLKTDLLQQLNPGVNLNRVRAGDVLNVPNVRDANAPPVGQIAALVVSGTDNYVQAMDAGGRILYHFAATLGSTYDPSPQGDFRVTSVHENPWWRYQPRLLAHVDDSKPEAMIPPGPNSAVGRVWMSLSAPHYGIHGTKSPETIGYAQSAGCVRLTNWDALFLSKRIGANTPVQFRGTRARVAPPAPAAAPPAPAGPALLGVRADSARAQADSAAPAPQPAADSTPKPEPAPAAPAPAPPPAPPPPPAQRETEARP